MRNIRITEHPDRVCLPNNYSATAFHTLCGWCDVPHEETDDPVTCHTCRQVVEHVLALAQSRGVIRSVPRSPTVARIMKAT